ncbi:MAG: hypothetical protein ACRD4M_05740 [Candidatus Acidiferrales bacterium]
MLSEKIFTGMRTGMRPERRRSIMARADAIEIALLYPAEFTLLNVGARAAGVKRVDARCAALTNYPLRGGRVSRRVQIPCIHWPKFYHGERRQRKTGENLQVSQVCAFSPFIDQVTLTWSSCPSSRVACE